MFPLIWLITSMMLDLTQEIKREDTVTTIKEQLLMAQKKEQMFTVI